MAPASSERVETDTARSARSCLERCAELITDFLLEVLRVICFGIVDALPAWTMPVDTVALQGIKDTVYAWDKWIPVVEVFNIGVAVATIFVALIAFKWVIKVVDWIADIIP